MDPFDRNRLILECGFVAVGIIVFFLILANLPWQQVNP